MTAQTDWQDAHDKAMTKRAAFEQKTAWLAGQLANANANGEVPTAAAEALRTHYNPSTKTEEN